MESHPPVFEDLTTLKEAVTHIRKESVRGHLVEKDSLKDVVGIRQEDIESLLARILDFPEWIALKTVTDDDGVVYLYSGGEMTDRYVEILMGLKRKDLLSFIAEAVRYESRKYPRPTRVDLFTKEPYSIGYEALTELLDSLGEESEYNDLKFTTASNGTRFIFSEHYLTEFHASRLAEWCEVLQHETP